MLSHRVLVTQLAVVQGLARRFQAFSLAAIGWSASARPREAHWLPAGARAWPGALIGGGGRRPARRPRRRWQRGRGRTERCCGGGGGGGGGGSGGGGGGSSWLAGRGSGDGGGRSAGPVSAAAAVPAELPDSRRGAEGSGLTPGPESAEAALSGGVAAMNRGGSSPAAAANYLLCTNCRKVLRKDKRIRVSQPLTRGPSAFIPEKEVVRANTVDERTNLLVEEYSTSGRLDNITQVMSLHTQYLESFLRSQFYMLRMDGPLPLPYRHYIAVMAAARHQCSYLINMHVDEFLKTGGIAEWLNGLEYVPQRLRNLNDINKLLAHRPWLITKEHIQKLVKTGENNWSLPELVHAVVLLAHYHALASFVFGSGINPERDPEISNGFRLISVNNFCVCDLANDNSIENASLTGNSFGIVDSLSELEALMERMKRLQEDREDEEATQEEMTTRFEKEKKESLFVVSGEAFHSFPHSDFEDDMTLRADVSRYIEDPGFGYEDFARRGEEHLPTFRAQDYTWENHGFSLVNRLYSDIGHLLDEKFRMVYNLTYNTMATHEDVDTTTLRRALFNYVHCMFGIRYDDYDYGEVNQLLERSLKVYIKTVTCYPERTTKRMYDSYWRQFKHSEKVHVNLLLMEARMQAELLYALRAITRYLT